MKIYEIIVLTISGGRCRSADPKIICHKMPNSFICSALGVVLPICLLYAFGGVPCVLWGFFARVAWKSYGFCCSEAHRCKR